jgi:hypothetical protein
LQTPCDWLLSSDMVCLTSSRSGGGKNSTKSGVCMFWSVYECLYVVCSCRWSELKSMLKKDCPRTASHGTPITTGATNLSAVIHVDNGRTTFVPIVPNRWY